MHPGRFLVKPPDRADLATDVVVIGSGIAGLRAALAAARSSRVIAVTKDRLTECNSWRAQGGIAAAIAETDGGAVHVEDTLKAGADLCDRAAVEALVAAGGEAIEELVAFGAKFDRDENDPERPALAREGAHSVSRILRAGGDAIGVELERTLLERARENGSIEFFENATLLDLLTDETGRARGVTLQMEPSRDVVRIDAAAVILATGGIGHLFASTTNSFIATGDGLAAAHRAGATLTDLEFMQFHPTTLHLEGAPRFLISEAVRGEGAILVDGAGRRVMEGRHPMLDLAPRDVVSREILRSIAETGHPCVYLDITGRDPAWLAARFPKIHAACLRYGIDISTDPIPVRPSAHYHIGGVATDAEGATDVPGLFACGESAATGVHGANRLASNSLLECVVFGRAAGRAAARWAKAHRPGGGAPLPEEGGPAGDGTAVPAGAALDLAIEQLRRENWEALGVVRDGPSLSAHLARLEARSVALPLPSTLRKRTAWINMTQVSALLARSALARKESRGTHYRADFPAPDPRFRGRFRRKHDLLAFEGATP